MIEFQPPTLAATASPDPPELQARGMTALNERPEMHEDSRGAGLNPCAALPLVGAAKPDQQREEFQRLFSTAEHTFMWDTIDDTKYSDLYMCALQI